MQYFFFLTGIHGIHLLIGFVTLGVLVHQLSDPETALPTDDRDVLHLLAHGRSLLGAHLRHALHREVTVETSGKKRLLGAWLVLVAITLIYLWIDHSADDLRRPGREHGRHRGRDRPRAGQVPDHPA